MKSGQAAAQTQTRRVLMIAYGFPPTGGPGVQRPVKFAKHLPTYGWHPIIWTVDHVDGMPHDSTLLSDLPPEVSIRRWDGKRVRSPGGRTDESPGGILERVTRTIERGLISRMASRFASKNTSDEGASWAQSSEAPLRALLERERIDAIYSTFSPPANHGLARALKQLTDLPWVADFRDLWTDDYRYNEPSSRERASHRRLEQQFLEAADAVIGVSDRQTRILGDHMPMLRHKFTTITNGFDHADFAKPRSSGPADGSFVLAHVGRFDRWRAVESWFGGLRRFVAKLGLRADRFVLRIVGHASETMRARLRATGARCFFTGYVSHNEAIREMRAASALLLSVPDGPNADSVIPAKLFEYLASRRPILVVGPPGGECDKIVSACEAGVSAHFDEGRIASALESLFSAREAGREMSGCRSDRLAPFERGMLAGKLAAVLRRVVGEQQMPVDASPHAEEVPIG